MMISGERVDESKQGEEEELGGFYMLTRLIGCPPQRVRARVEKDAEHRGLTFLTCQSKASR